MLSHKYRTEEVHPERFDFVEDLTVKPTPRLIEPEDIINGVELEEPLEPEDI